MTVAMSTDLGAGGPLAATGLGAGRDSGLGAGANLSLPATSVLGTAKGAGGAAGTFDHTADGSSIEGAVLMAGSSQARANSGTHASVPATSSFKANWQSTLRALGVATNTEVETDGEAGNTARELGAAGENNIGQGGGAVPATFVVTDGWAAPSSSFNCARNELAAGSMVTGAASGNLSRPGLSVAIVTTGTRTASLATGAVADGSSMRSTHDQRLEKHAAEIAGSSVAAQASSQPLAWPIVCLAAGVPQHATAALPARIAPVNPDAAATSSRDMDDDASLNLNATVSADPRPAAVAASTHLQDGSTSMHPVTNLGIVSHVAGASSSAVLRISPTGETSDADGSPGVTTAYGEREEVAASSLEAAAAVDGGPNAGTALRLGTYPSIEERRAVICEGIVGRSAASESSVALQAAESQRSSVESASGPVQRLHLQAVRDVNPQGASAGTLEQTTQHVAMPSSPMESQTMMRDPAGIHVPVNAFGVTSNAIAGSPPVEQGPFAALDAGTATAPANWVHAGGRQAEAGFEDPALGWVGVRADLVAGGIHAAVIPASADAAQALSGHLAGLSAYLDQNHTQVATLTVAAAEHGTTESSAQQGTEQGMDQGMHEGASQGQNQNPVVELNTPFGAPRNEVPGTTGSDASDSQFDGVRELGVARGMHISVMV